MYTAKKTINWQCGMGNIVVCWGMEDGSDCLHPIISKYPIVPHASVPVIRAVGSFSHNFANLQITTCFVTCVCSTGCVVAAPEHCLSIMHDDCGSYHLPYSAQTAAIPRGNHLRMSCMFQHLTSSEQNYKHWKEKGCSHVTRISFLTPM